jgi:hypothetical protein
MRYSEIFTVIMLLSFPVLADMTPEERCEKRGDVAKEASKMRISGADKDTATNALIEIYDHPDSGVTANNVHGLVMVSYMAKMKPDNMRNYVIDQCEKDILN